MYILYSMLFKCLKALALKATCSAFTGFQPYTNLENLKFFYVGNCGSVFTV